MSERQLAIHSPCVFNCPGMIQNAYCIEGEDGIFRLLQYNLREFKNVKLFHLMFSSEQGIENRLSVTTLDGKFHGRGTVARQPRA